MAQKSSLPEEVRAPYMSNETDEEVLVDAEWSELRGLRRMGKQRWWRVCGKAGGARTLMEISKEEGERMRAEIEDPKWSVGRGET